MDLRNFVSADALNLFLETKGWKMIKPIAQGKYGKICARGQSKINHQGNSFDSVEMLISKHGKTAIGDFDNWEFLEEKEWVIYKNGDWLHSFTTLLELPKASKFRC